MKNLKKIYKNKKVLITGHSGFKGSWLTIWLNLLGSNILGISDKEVSMPNHFRVTNLKKFINSEWIDIVDTKKTIKIIQKFNPDFIFHLAAQPLVYSSYVDPLNTIKTNSIGTLNVLESLRHIKKKVVTVFITSDKVYDNLEWIWGYREIDKLGGKDPYSGSKAMAELAIKSYTASFFNEKNNNKIIGVARAGNVIGGGDWAKNRIVPDCVKAWSSNLSVSIRNPHSTRPWQHVLEPLSGYLVLGAYLTKKNNQNDTAYNFGPLPDQNHSVKSLINEMKKSWNRVSWKDVSQSKDKFNESGLLKLNCDKASAELNWNPVLTFEETIKFTVEWYKKYYEDTSKSMLKNSEQQLINYINLANKRGLTWAQ
jgi:CDP-glucose 4,6-dehydratase